MRIGLVHPFSWPEVVRGGERYLADLAWYLARRDHDVEVITGTTGPSSASIVDGVSMRRLRHIEHPTLSRRGVTARETFGIRSLASLLRRRYDVVHALTPTAALAARLAGQRTIFSFLGHPSPELFADAARWQKALLARAVRSANVALALSEVSAHSLAAFAGREVGALYFGVRLEEFPLNPEPRSGPARILFPAFAGHPQKGLGVLLEAMPRLLERHPDASLTLAGPGDSDWAFAALGPAEALVRSVTKVLGAVPSESMPRLFRESHVSALPSMNEALGIVFVESLASGTPAVCSHTESGGPEIVSSSHVGRTVPFGDVGALVDALDQTIMLARDPATPARCRERAQRWDWETSIGPQHEALYARVAGRRAGSRRNQG